jgi:hypothetical protein
MGVQIFFPIFSSLAACPQNSNMPARPASADVVFYSLAEIRYQRGQTDGAPDGHGREAETHPGRNGESVL